MLFYEYMLVLWHVGPVQACHVWFDSLLVLIIFGTTSILREITLLAGYVNLLYVDQDCIAKLTTYVKIIAPVILSLHIC